MSYLCRKGLNISGTAYKPGDVIPDGAILPNRVLIITFTFCFDYQIISHRTQGNSAQFPPYGLSTAPAAAARQLRCQNAR